MSLREAVGEVGRLDVRENAALAASGSKSLEAGLARLRAQRPEEWFELLETLCTLKPVATSSKVEGQRTPLLLGKAARRAVMP